MTNSIFEPRTTSTTVRTSTSSNSRLLDSTSLIFYYMHLETFPSIEKLVAQNWLPFKAVPHYR